MTIIVSQGKGSSAVDESAPKALSPEIVHNLKASIEVKILDYGKVRDVGDSLYTTFYIIPTCKIVVVFIFLSVTRHRCASAAQCVDHFAQ